MKAGTRKFDILQCTNCGVTIVASHENIDEYPMTYDVPISCCVKPNISWAKGLHSNHIYLKSEEASP